MKNYIEKVFAPILSKIKDEDIRNKTVECWVKGAEEGGWKPEDLEKIPFTLLTETHGVNLIEHTIAVTLGAASLAEAKNPLTKLCLMKSIWIFFIPADCFMMSVNSKKSNV